MNGHFYSSTGLKLGNTFTWLWKAFEGKIFAVTNQTMGTVLRNASVCSTILLYIHSLLPKSDMDIKCLTWLWAKYLFV